MIAYTANQVRRRYSEGVDCRGVSRENCCVVATPILHWLDSSYVVKQLQEDLILQFRVSGVLEQVMVNNGTWVSKKKRCGVEL